MGVALKPDLHNKVLVVKSTMYESISPYSSCGRESEQQLDLVLVLADAPSGTPGI